MTADFLWKYYKNHKHLLFDILVIIIVLLISTLLVTSNIEERILSNFVGYEFIPKFLAGIFSVNFITALPAYTFLLKVVTEQNFWTVVFMTSIGSVVGDTMIFSFLKFRLLESLLKSFKKNRHVVSLLRTKNKILRGLLILVGFGVMASPLPDEVAVLLISLSRINHKYFIIISLVLNFIGAYLLFSYRLFI